MNPVLRGYPNDREIKGCTGVERGNPQCVIYRRSLVVDDVIHLLSDFGVNKYVCLAIST